MESNQTLIRGLKILLSFNEKKTSQTINEIANTVGMPRTSVYRFLATLQNYGLIELNKATGKYTLGLRLLELKMIAQSKMSIVDISIPFMKKLSTSTKETVKLTLLYRDQGICAHIVESPSPLRVASPPGQLFPLHAGASCQVIMAFLPEEHQKRILERPLKRLTAKTIIESDKLKRRLREVNRDGYSITKEEVHLGVFDISAPISNGEQRIEASITVSGPIAHLKARNVDQMVQDTLRTANEISNQLP